MQELKVITRKYTYHKTSTPKSRYMSHQSKEIRLPIVPIELHINPVVIKICSTPSLASSGSIEKQLINLVEQFT